MSTSYADFAATLTGLEVDGVTRYFAYPPASLETADLPAKWVQRVRGSEVPMTFGAHGGWTDAAAQIVIAINSTAQDLQVNNIVATRAMMDSVSVAIRESACREITGRTAWEIAEGVVTVAGHDYWAVIIDITVSR